MQPCVLGLFPLGTSLSFIGPLNRLLVLVEVRRARLSQGVSESGFHDQRQAGAAVGHLSGSRKKGNDLDSYEAQSACQF